MFVNRKEYEREVNNLTELIFSFGARVTMLEERASLLERTLDKLIADKKPAKKVAAPKRTQK